MLGAIHLSFSYCHAYWWPGVTRSQINSRHSFDGIPGYSGLINRAHIQYDVIMSAMASQITGVSIVCSIVCSDADQRKNQSPTSLAFVRDTVNHEILLDKLYHYGIRDNALPWFQSYLTEQQQFVAYNGVSSHKKTIKCSVPQGSILGPLLFLVYINVPCMQ